MAVTPANRSQRCETAEAIGQVVMVADENPPGPQLSPQQKSVMPNTSVEGLLSLQIRLTVAKTSSPHHGMAVQLGKPSDNSRRRAIPMEASSTSHWHRWFAWRPVFVETRINRPLMWLRYVERRWTEGKTSGLGPRWIYRSIRTGERR